MVAWCGPAAPKDFLRAKHKGNPEEQPCQPNENSVLPDYVTQIKKKKNPFETGFIIRLKTLSFTSFRMYVLSL